MAKTRLPFTPAVYEHAARRINRTPWETSRDPELLYAGHRAAYLEYQDSTTVAGWQRTRRPTLR